MTDILDSGWVVEVELDSDFNKLPYSYLYFSTIANGFHGKYHSMALIHYPEFIYHFNDLELAKAFTEQVAQDQRVRRYFVKTVEEYYE